MKGIRIRGKFPQNYYESSKRYYRIDYNFSELIEPISTQIQDYYWLSEDLMFAFDNIEDEIFEKEFESYSMQHFGSFVLRNKKFLIRYAEYVIHYWTNIYGINKPIYIWEVTDKFGWNLIESKIFNHTEIFFSCIDGAYWEVFSKHPDIINKIKRKFTFSEESSFDDRWG